MQPFPPNSPIYRKAPHRARTIALVAIVALFLIGFIPKFLHSRSLAKETREETTRPPEVEVAEPVSKTPEPLLLPGTMQSLTNTVVQARATGYVRKLYVDIGSVVKAGQLLAEIESPDTDQQAIQATAQTAQSQATVGQSVAQVARQTAAVRQAEASFASAGAKVAQAVAAEYQAKATVVQRRRQVQNQRATLTQARAQYQLAYTTVKRYETLLQQGFVAQQEYDQAAAEYKTRAAAVLAAEAGVASAQADEQAAEQTVRAQRALVEAAQSDADAAHANIRAAQQDVNAGLQLISANQSAVEANRANERRFAALRGFERVTAPYDGVITARNVDIGSLISGGVSTVSSGSTSSASPSASGSTGSPASVPTFAITAPTTGIFGIARVDTLLLLVNVPQTYAQAIPNGSPAKVVIREFPGETFVGKVVLRSGAVDAQSRTRLMEIDISNRDDRLLPGMFAQAIIAPSSARPVLRVPANVVMYGTEGTRVAIVGRDSTVSFKSITVGRDFGTDIEVVEGLRGGERLVSNPTDDLQDGQKVRVLPPKKKKKGSEEGASGGGANEGQGGGGHSGGQGGGAGGGA